MFVQQVRRLRQGQVRLHAASPHDASSTHLHALFPSQSCRNMCLSSFAGHAVPAAQAGAKPHGKSFLGLLSHKFRKLKNVRSSSSRSSNGVSRTRGDGRGLSTLSRSDEGVEHSGPGFTQGHALPLLLPQDLHQQPPWATHAAYDSSQSHFSQSLGLHSTAGPQESPQPSAWLQAAAADEMTPSVDFMTYLAAAMQSNSHVGSSTTGSAGYITTSAGLIITTPADTPDSDSEDARTSAAAGSGAAYRSTPQSTHLYAPSLYSSATSTPPRSPLKQLQLPQVTRPQSPLQLHQLQQGYIALPSPAASISSASPPRSPILNQPQPTLQQPAVSPQPPQPLPLQASCLACDAAGSLKSGDHSSAGCCEEGRACEEGCACAVGSTCSCREGPPPARAPTSSPHKPPAPTSDHRDHGTRDLKPSSGPARSAFSAALNAVRPTQLRSAACSAAAAVRRMPRGVVMLCLLAFLISVMMLSRGGRGSVTGPPPHTCSVSAPITQPEHGGAYDGLASVPARAPAPPPELWQVMLSGGDESEGAGRSGVRIAELPGPYTMGHIWGVGMLVVVVVGLVGASLVQRALQRLMFEGEQASPEHQTQDETENWLQDQRRWVGAGLCVFVCVPCVLRGWTSTWHPRG